MCPRLQRISSSVQSHIIYRYCTRVPCLWTADLFYVQSSRPLRFHSPYKRIWCRYYLAGVSVLFSSTAYYRDTWPRKIFMICLCKTNNNKPYHPHLNACLCVDGNGDVSFKLVCVYVWWQLPFVSIFPLTTPRHPYCVCIVVKGKIIIFFFIESAVLVWIFEHAERGECIFVRFFHYRIHISLVYVILGCRFITFSL